MTRLSWEFFFFSIDKVCCDDLLTGVKFNDVLMLAGKCLNQSLLWCY